MDYMDSSPQPMKQIDTLTTFLFALLFRLSILKAKEPLMPLKGKLLAEETFDSPDIPESWKTYGDVKVADNTLQVVYNDPLGPRDYY